ncbi:MAG: PulJ/GspJ family protein [Planctomycetota bacterium]
MIRQSHLNSKSLGQAFRRGRDARRPGQHRRNRRAFSIIEVLIAMSISAMLLSSVMMALQASFRAYQATTESASRHTIARLMMHRVLGLVRTGEQFGPFPNNVIVQPIISSDYMEFLSATGEIIRIEYRPDDETIFLIQDPGGSSPNEQILITGVVPQFDVGGTRVKPFRLHYGLGPSLYRATIDLMIAGDPDVQLTIEGDDVPPLRMVASTMPRNNI